MSPTAFAFLIAFVPSQCLEQSMVRRELSVPSPRSLIEVSDTSDALDGQAEALYKVQAALRRERKRGHFTYWSALPSQTNFEKRQLNTIKQGTSSCSRVLHHSGLLLGDMADMASSEFCDCVDIELQGHEFPVCCHSRFALLLEYAAWTLPKFNITWWIDSGTLLGSLREGGFINHDSDTDISFLLTSPEDESNIRRWFLHAAEDGMGQYTSKNEFNLHLLGEHLDMYIYRSKNDGKVIYYEGDPLWETTILGEAIFPLQASCNFHGFLMPCPQNAELHLQTRYKGSDLMVPEHRWCHEAEHEKLGMQWLGPRGASRPPCQKLQWPDISEGISASIECLKSNGNSFLQGSKVEPAVHKMPLRVEQESALLRVVKKSDPMDPLDLNPPLDPLDDLSGSSAADGVSPNVDDDLMSRQVLTGEKADDPYGVID